MDTQAKLRAASRHVLRLLAEHQYAALSDLTTLGPKHLRPEEIAAAVRLYPGTIRMPTDEELTIEVIEIEGSSPRQFSVDAPVFTVEEGMSDLSIRLTVTDLNGAEYGIEFYDVWVM